MKGEPEHADDVSFFNVSLTNANVMSMPRFPQPQRLVGEIIHSIEAASPSFAWVQFLFKRTNLTPTLVSLKNSIQSAATMIKTPKTSLITGIEHDRRELHRDWYGRSGERMKRIDTVVNMPHVLLAIQGMWVGDRRSLSALPFKDCYDEYDRLGVFVYRNPWMLAELVERRMVEEVSSYFMSYTSSRWEPPSFMITQEEVPYYIHLPIAKQTDSLKSIIWKQHSAEVREGTVEGVLLKTGFPHSNLVKLAKVPLIGEPLKEKETERLSLLPSTSVRTFELLFTGGRTEFVLSSRSERDAQEYVGVLESVYGELDIARAPVAPDFLREVPRIVRLVP
ncbi:MAG TPA: hypothetical protein VGR56_01975 [Nitrososphaerales archaeon]|nr:hypothetical protein [Nitrososphaerales archaeon]